MHKRLVASVLVVLAALAFAAVVGTSTTEAKALRYRIVKRAPHAVFVQRGQVVMSVRGSRHSSSTTHSVAET